MTRLSKTISDPDIPLVTPDCEIPEFPVVVIDGTCALCNRVARIIDKLDRSGEIRIAASQGPDGASIMCRHGLDPNDLSSWLFLENGVAYTEMDAVVRLAGRLGGSARFLLILKLLPGFLRTRIYRWIARNRYCIFGQDNLCITPSPSLRARILDLNPEFPVHHHGPASISSGNTDLSDLSSC